MVQTIMLLSDVMNRQAKKLTLEVPIQEIDNKAIDFISELLRNYSGDKSLEITVFEKGNPHHKINMASRKYKIDISKELISALEREQWKYNLN